MTTYFFPSCKVQQQFPQSSRHLQEYLTTRWQISITGCCRQNHNRLLPEDSALFICNTCAHILAESSAARQIKSVWELIDQDADFDFPNYRGEIMSIQDCWLANDRPEMQQAVRSLLHKMHIKALEMPNNLTQTGFCGTNISASTARLAPGFSQKAGQMSAKERAKHLRQSKTEKVICYCRPCLAEINAAGLQGQHLLPLLFNAHA